MIWPLAVGVSLGLVSCNGDLQQEAKQELHAKAYNFTVEDYMRAAKDGHVAALKNFLAAGMDVNAKDAEGVNALFRAAQSGQAAAVKFLAAQGAQVNVTGTGWDTPLVAAARSGSTDTVLVLLEEKADPNVRTEKNWTALTAATFKGKAETVKALAPLSRGSLDEALQIAALQGRTEIIDILLGAGANVFNRSKENKTPLMYAAANGHVDAVKLLLVHGSNRFAIDSADKTAADLAQTAGHSSVVAMLNDPNLPTSPHSEVVKPGAEPTTPAAGTVVDVPPAQGIADSGEAGSAPAEGPAPRPNGGTAITEAGNSSPRPTGGGMVATEAAASLASAGSHASTVNAHGDGTPSAVAGERSAPRTAERPGLAVLSLRGQTDDSPADAPASGEPTETPAPRSPRSAGSPPEYPRIAGTRLREVPTGASEQVRETLHMKDFRESQLPIILEDVPASRMAKIRVLSKADPTPEIVTTGGPIGDTGLELVKAEKRVMASKMGEGRWLDVSQVVVRDRTTGLRHLVVKDNPASASEAMALVSVGDKTYDVREGDEFTVGEADPASYRVLEVRPTQVVVENTASREPVTLERSYAR